MNKNYLGKKRKDDNKKEEIDNINYNEINDYSDSIEQYKNIFNKKIKLSNKINKTINNEIENQKIIFNKNSKLNLNKKNDNILPKPKYELIDKSSKLFLNSKNFETKYTNLINPDNIRLIKIEEEKKNLKKNNINNNINKNYLEDNKILEINQNSLLDKNWEEKYINYLNKKEYDNNIIIDNENNNDNMEENNLQNIIETYKKQLNNVFDNNDKKSQKETISTKKRYGW